MVSSSRVAHELEGALVTAIVPALAAHLAAGGVARCEEIGRRTRLWALRLVAGRCALGRGLPPLAEADGGVEAQAALDALGLDWGALPARMLGEVYEGLLRRRLVCDGGRFSLAADRGGRRATGSFYTPEPIVERIVAATLGPLFAASDSVDGEQEDGYALAILDPAMGSGHFLLAAVDAVCAWLAVRGVSRADPPIPLSPALSHQGRGGNLMALRQLVLERYIYGVDSDPDAVAVARLCLWLHCAAPGTPLDACGGNLRCGNSLLGPGFAPQGGDNASQAERFDWPANFPEIAIRGGFAAVVGNPPYMTRLSREERQAALGWTTTRGRELDTFYLFVERSAHLLRAGGRCGVIIPNVFLRQHESAPFRRFLLGQTIETITDYGFAAFGGATVPTAVLVFGKGLPLPGHTITFEEQDGTEGRLPQAAVAALPGAQLSQQLAAAQPLLAMLEQVTAPLETFATSHEGIHSGNVRQKLFTREGGAATARRMLKGRDIKRYDLHWGGWYVRYDPTLIDRRGGEYASLRDERLFTAPKIWTRQTGDRLIATFDEAGFYADNTLHATQLRPGCPLSPLYLLALLNSRLLTAIYRTLTGERGRPLAQVKLVVLRRLPIRPISFTTPPAARMTLVQEVMVLATEGTESTEMVIDGIVMRARSWLQGGQEDVVHDLLAALAQEMLALSERRDERAAALDTLIDGVVEALYGVRAEVFG